MLLFDLIKNTNGKLICGINREIDEFSVLANNSKDKLFFALKGKNDGNDFINIALETGAVGVVVECKEYFKIKSLTELIVFLDGKIDVLLLKDTAVIVTGDVRKYYSDLSRKIFNYPDNSLVVIGVTGTNGKTTTTHIIRDMLSFYNKKVGLIGTNGYYFGGEKLGGGLTTPDSFDFYKVMSKMLKMGAEYIVTELSAHALYLDKLYSLSLDVAAVTNLSRDHLDYFKTMNNYAAAKRKILSMGAKTVVLNSEDEFCFALSKEVKNSVTYGLFLPSDVFAVNADYVKNGTRAYINAFDEVFPVMSPLYGEYNLYNLLCAIAVVYKLGFTKDLDKAVNYVKEVPGRFNTVRFGDVLVVIDYAHTPDGLEKVLKCVKSLDTDKIITVFGCGGDRDKGKRSLMGKVASMYSDEIVLTKDNSRMEDPLNIINEIIPGIDKAVKYTVEPDRKKAIQIALERCEKGVVVIAGKGAENYIEEKGAKIYFNDKETVLELTQKNDT